MQRNSFTFAAIRRRGHLWLIKTLLCAVSAHSLTGCDSERHTPPLNAAVTDTTTARHSVAIRKPSRDPVILTGTVDEKGNPVTMTCATCHSTKPPNADAKLGLPLLLFHQGLVGKHGKLSCLACHNSAEGNASLRLADGKSVAYAEVMTLCAQCHGPQFRDYQHGAHGGMTGFWDLTKGGQMRNNCVDCHDPHAPKYPTVAPARGPNDRFQSHGGGHE